MMNPVNVTTKTEVLEGVTRWAIEVGEIYDLIVAEKEYGFREVGFLPIAEQTVVRINTEASLSVQNYEHIMDTFSVRHILKKHGTAAEFKRGQVPITKQDLVELPHLLLAPDTVENGGKTKQGRDTVCYTKVIGEYLIFYTEEVRTKKNRLAAVTLYKRKTKADPTPDAPFTEGKQNC